MNEQAVEALEVEAVDAVAAAGWGVPWHRRGRLSAQPGPRQPRDVLTDAGVTTVTPFDLVDEGQA